MSLPAVDPPASTAGPTAALDKRKSLILGAIGLFFIVLIFWKVIPQIGGSYAEAWAKLEAMSGIAIAGIVLSVLIYLALYGLPFMAATPGLRYWPSQQVNQSAFVISNGVPAGGAVGLAVQFAMLASYRIPATTATAAITAVGLWSTFVSLGFPILGVVGLSIAGGATTYSWLGPLGLAILVAAVLLFVLVMRSERLAQAVGRLANRLIGPLRGRVHRLADVDAVGPITRFRADMYDVLKRRWAALTAAQIGVSVGQFLILYVTLRGIEGWDQSGTSVLVAFAAFATSQIMLMVPITPGGVGTVDALMITLLISMGVDEATATAADVVWRFASYFPQIVIGILALVAWYRRAGQAFARTSTTS